MTRLFKTLYPDFAGMGVVQDYAATVGEPRLGLSENSNLKESLSCIVFPNKTSAEQGVDLLYGDGVQDPDNLLGPLWEGQQIAVGKKDSLGAQMKVLQCPDKYWIINAQRTYSPEEGTQTIIVDMARIKSEKNGPGLTTAIGVFRFYNGEFNNWQGEWEAQVGDRWLSVSRLREKLQKGLDFNEAMRQLEKEVKQQSKNQLVDPKGLRGIVHDPRNLNPGRQAKLGGFSTKGFWPRG